MIAITTTSLPYAVTGVLYSEQLTSDSSETVVWSLASGSLPVGLSLSSAGAISGTPTAVNSNTTGTTSTFTVKAADSSGETTKSLSIVLFSKPNITTATAANVVSGRAYTQSFVTTGTTPRTATIDSGVLPTGLVFNPSTTGNSTITGTVAASEAGQYPITIKIVNAYGEFTKQFTIDVTNVAPAITTSSIPNVFYQELFGTNTLEISGSLPITFSLDSGNLPDGISLNANTGEISGAATVKDNFSFTIRVTNAFGTATRAFTINVLWSDIFEGLGTENEPFLIQTAADLAQLATLVNANTIPYSQTGVHYKLVNDIDLSEYGESWNNGQGWIPIGNDTNNFKGNFDGCGHIITGLYIKNSLRENGLFGRGSPASIIKNVGILNGHLISIKNSQDLYMGTLIGESCGIVRNCFSTAKVEPYFNIRECNIGGLVGLTYNLVENCYTTGVVINNTSQARTGGVVGRCVNGVIKNCYSTCPVNTFYISSGVVGLSSTGLANSLTTNCVALNENLSTPHATYFYRVVFAQGGKSINNAAFKDMLNPQGLPEWSPKGLDTNNGADITKEEINADPSIGGRFLEENG